MKLGLSTAALYGRLETEEAAAYIAAHGFDCAEAFLQTWSEYDLPFAAQVRRNLDPVPCTSVHPAGIQFENQMIARSFRQRSDAYSVFSRVLDACAEMGAGTYVYHGRSTALLHPLPWDLQRNLDALDVMCRMAGERGVRIGWENVSWCQLTTPERVLEARSVFEPVRYTLDIKQAMRAGVDPVQMARAMGDRLINVHILDWKEDGSLCLPGEGVFDFEALFTALTEIGYDGPVIEEPYSALVRSDEALMQSVQYVRDVMERIRKKRDRSLEKQDACQAEGRRKDE